MARKRYFGQVSFFNGILLFSLLLGALMSKLFAASTQIRLIADPLVLQIPIHENHEALVDLKKQGGIAYGPSPEIPNNSNYTSMRKTVYEKL